MKVEVIALLERARESIKATELLLSTNSPDIAASRAYYAMFYTAEALLANQGLFYSSHGAVQAAYGKQFAKKGKLPVDFHRWLIDAQDLRNLGDYGGMQHVDINESREVCHRATEFLLASEAYLKQQDANP